MTIADKGTKKHIIVQLIRFHNTATALNISIFIFNHIFNIRIYFINGITGDADALRGPRKSVDGAGCSPRPWAVWYKLSGFAVFVET